jgi:hypothetical protein
MRQDEKQTKTAWLGTKTKERIKCVEQQQQLQQRERENYKEQ